MIHKLQGSINYYNTQQELEGLITWCMIEVVGGEGGGGAGERVWGVSVCMGGGSWIWNVWLAAWTLHSDFSVVHAWMPFVIYKHVLHCRHIPSRIRRQPEQHMPSGLWGDICRGHQGSSLSFSAAWSFQPCGELVTVILLDCGSLVYSGHVVSCQLVSHSVRRWQSCVTQAMWWAGHSHSVRPWQSCVTPARW